MVLVQLTQDSALKKYIFMVFIYKTLSKTLQSVLFSFFVVRTYVAEQFGFRFEIIRNIVIRPVAFLFNESSLDLHITPFSQSFPANLRFNPHATQKW